VELIVGRLAPAEISGNRQHLRQVANNLIDNAIKYTPSGGRIEVNLFRNGDEQAQFVVRDTGIGISADDLPHVFERFFRADRSRSRMKDTLGTGLGLSICHAVVAAHHGRISCESEVGRGTTMTVVLPLISSGSQTKSGTDVALEESSQATSL
jgi:signal transduction histidine kinase